MDNEIDLCTNLTDNINIDKRPLCTLDIGNGCITYSLYSKPPNWWHRMWQRLLLGFKWTTLR